MIVKIQEILITLNAFSQQVNDIKKIKTVTKLNSPKKSGFMDCGKFKKTALKNGKKVIRF